MPDSSISPPSSVGHRPLRERLLPSWTVGHFSRGRASPLAPIASSAIASSTATSVVDDTPSNDPQRRSHSSSPAAVAASPSPSTSPSERPGLRERLSVSRLYRHLSRALAPSSRDSPPIVVRLDSPQILSDALQVPTSSATDTGSGPPILPPSSVDVTPKMMAPSSDIQDASANLVTSVAPLDVADACVADPMAILWTQAVAEWQRKTGLDLTDPDAIALATKGAVMSYIAKMETMENESEKGEWEALRERVDPLARSLEKICDPIGDTFSAAFPPSKIVFAAVGLIVSAYVRTRDDFAQIGEAFKELQFHLQIVEIVADSHPGQVLHDACVQLLTKVLSVLGVVTEMRREGHLRKCRPLHISSRIASQTRPLSEALQNLRLLASSQQQAMAAVTLNKVTLLMETIASDKVSQEWVHGCLIDVLRATRENHDLGSLTHAEVVANRTALRRIELVMYNQSDKLRRIETFAEYEQIKAWLNYVDPSYRLRKLLDDRAEGTGSWFLDGDVFTALKEGKTKAVLLGGKAGSGKSTIIAAAVEALRAYHACDPRTLVLAHIFDSTNASSSQRDLHALLSTLLCQLALNNTHCASIISDSRKTIVANGLPTKARMKELFFETLRATSLHVIVVVDALDEAIDEDEIISFLQRLKAVSAISVLASRRPFTDSTRSLGSVVAVDNHGENNDIGLLLDIAMSQGGDLAKVQVDRNGVREKLLAGAERK
ncbi:hypothetical protein K525DRAFT_213240 [Schizophyllum commune Loenen D]|nr:hypothetical protein K525DRAFT_213240 [Schizophyllum commune Loenen D]